MIHVPAGIGHWKYKTGFRELKPVFFSHPYFQNLILAVQILHRCFQKLILAVQICTAVFRF